MKCFLPIMWFFLLSALSAQEPLVYTRHFTDEIDRLGIQFYAPTETWLHLRPEADDDFLDYDLVLWSDDGSTDIRFVLEHVDDRAGLLQFPHIEFSRVLATLASNDESEDVLISSLPESFVQDQFQADWAILSDFTPKPWVSDKPYGRLYGLFKDERGLAFCIILSTSADIDAIFRRLIRFDPAPETEGQ